MDGGGLLFVEYSCPSIELLPVHCIASGLLANFSSIMIWPFYHKAVTRYWLKVFAWYAFIEACIQLLFFFILNTFGKSSISDIEIHLLMWTFQCLLIWPIWLVAWSVSKQPIIVQVLVNIIFYVVYSYGWFGPVQQMIGYLHENLQLITRAENDRIVPMLDSGSQYAYLNYQLLKHAFRLSWFFLAAYFYNYQIEEKKRAELAVANKELQLKMLKWHLNPAFYFNTIHYLQQLALDKPVNATEPILQLAKVMEYVIYETKEKLIDVKREIQFLVNYIQLLNRQHNRVQFETKLEGDYEKLKISPLLLVGFIDKLYAENGLNEQQIYKLHINFTGNKMLLVVEECTGLDNRLQLHKEDDLNKRLAKLYPDKFSFSNPTGNGLFKLSLILHHES